MNDIIVEIECPNGTTVALLQQTGGGNWLGEPIDNENGTQGIGYEYFWSPDATITLGEFANLNGDTPSGEYLAEGDLCDLVGCPVNGNWIFHFQDVVGSDDGFVFQTAINFNISVSQYIAYTQTFGVDADSTYWTGPGILDTDPDMDIVSIDTAIPGSFDYTYIALGSSGCQYEAYTNITVVGIPDAPVITLNGNVLSSTIAPSYQWYLNGNLLNGATSMTYNPTQSGSYIVAVSDVLGCNTFFSNVIVYTIIDVSEIENENQFQAFPNPFNQSITLQHLDQDGRKCNKVQIVDLLGKTQFEKSITIANSSLTISTEHFSSGIYFVRLFSDNQVLRVEKIVKSN